MTKMGEGMKAIVYHSYGSPDVLHCEEIGKPTVGDSKVRIKVRAAGLNPLDAGELKGVPYLARIIFGLRKPDKSRPGRPGVDLAGEVEAVGKKVTRFQPGDKVFGVCINNPNASGAKVWVHDEGAFAECVCVPELSLAIKPDNVTFEQAAAVGLAALTALQGLRDHGHIQPGHKVLVNGAAGGVGTFAVQIAKALGAEVTGVCRTSNVELVRSIGADDVVDYTRQDFTRLEQRYDLILDCVSNHSLSEYRQILSANGVLVMAGDRTDRGLLGIMGRLMAALMLTKLTGLKFVTFLAKPREEDLVTIQELIKSGKVTPVLDKSYSLSQTAEALRYLEQKHARGKVVITVA
jgi:NADPH:quinone reductase-like Zn-dependent oxidoreductase